MLLGHGAAEVGWEAAAFADGAGVGDEDGGERGKVAEGGRGVCRVPRADERRGVGKAVGDFVEEFTCW